MPDYTVLDRAEIDIDRITTFGSDSFVTLYDEKGEELLTLEQFWFIYKKRNWTDNSYQYHLMIVEDEIRYDDQMKEVKTIRYTVNGEQSEPYEHNGIDQPEVGFNRTWLISVNKPKFRNNFFIGS